MQKKEIKHFSLRVDSETLSKFHYVCGYTGRSANNQLIQLMRKSIATYESQHGPIELEK